MDQIIEDLYDYWFTNPDIWFGCTEQIDRMLAEKYDEYILVYNNVQYKLDNKKYLIGLIILYDQIVRHINRVIPNKYSIDFNNKVAINISQQVYSIYKDLLNPDEFAFVMLPFRHSKKPENIFMVVKETWVNIEKSNTVSDSVTELKYKKFLKATYDKYIEQVNDLNNLVKYDNVTDINSFIISEHSDVLDVKCLESMEQIVISNDFIKNEIKDNTYDNFIFNIIDIQKRQPNIFPLILSISGGVDSMICSFLLKKAKIKFTCVHINYFNRKESMGEEEFVIKWCKFLQIPLYVRRIEEINRPMCMQYGLRELYENYTRDIRYGSYLNSIIGLDIDSDEDEDSDKKRMVNVILGHNKDDCFENIITNIASKSKYENLYGMDPITRITHKDEYINFLRPMLGINKDQIYEFAHKYNIPYLFDSTPKWSSRGKIRDIVRPCLHNFNSNLVNGIFGIQQVLKESLEMMDLLIETWTEKILENIDKKSIDKKIKVIAESKNNVKPVYNIEISINKLIKSKIFWSKLFVKLNIKASSRSLDEYLSKLNRLYDTFDKLEVNNLERYQINSVTQIKFLKTRTNKLIIEFG